jgi:hemolysin activation/secretion protein
VRGYSFDDGAFDDGLVLREEVRAPSLALSRGGGAWRLGPMAFADLGLGRNEAVRRDTEIGSIGVGASARLGRSVSADVWLSDPPDNAKVTRAGDWRLDTRISVSF